MSKRVRCFWYYLSGLLFFVFFMAGCSAMKDTYSAYDACRNDAFCYAQMEKGRDLVSAIATTASAAIPQTAPLSVVIGSGAGMLTSLLVGVYLGRKKVSK